MITSLPTQEQVDLVARTLAPDVVRIRLREGQDWSDDPALYFRVVLSDEASQKNRLLETSNRVIETVSDQLGLAELSHIAYFRFRSHSEQVKLQDQDWD